MSAEVKKEIQLEIAKVNAQDTSAEPKPDIQSFEYPIMSMNKQYAISSWNSSADMFRCELGAAGLRP